MYEILFTSDYEIHGSGSGSPRSLLLEPTSRMLAQFDRYGARLTIMADAGELLRFEEWSETHGEDRFAWGELAEQLRLAVRTGHDVQLHLHSSYFNAVWSEGCEQWLQDYAEYDLASLPRERVRSMIHRGKDLLERTCRPAKSDYECFAFRAANWSMQPSPDIVRALIDEGFRIDTSVWKDGQSDEMVRFDYRCAHSDLVPWPIDERDVCARDPAGKLFEFPIFTERRALWVFVTPNRLYRLAAQSLHPLPRPRPGLIRSSRSRPGSMAAGARRQSLLAKAATLFKVHPWKADFNQCTGEQLIDALRRVEKRYGHPHVPLPFVLIGHSKTFTRHNERTLRPFLEFVAEHPERFRFATFRNLDPERYRFF